MDRHHSLLQYRRVMFLGFLGMLGCLVVQAIPVVGAISWFLLSMLWFGLSLHLMLIATAYSAFRRTISRGWIVIPVTFYAACLLVYGYSNIRAAREVTMINTSNAAQHARVEQPFVYRSEERMAVGDTQLLERFRVEAAYLAGRDTTTVRSWRSGSACWGGSRHWDYQKRFETYFLYRKDLFPNYRGADKTQQCILAIDREGPPPPYRYNIIREESKSKGDWLKPRFGIDYTFTDSQDSKNTVSVHTGTVSTLPIIIIPAIQNMALWNGGNAGWEFALTGIGTRQFSVGIKPRAKGENQFSPPTNVDQTSVGILGRALGLEPRLPTDQSET